MPSSAATPSDPLQPVLFVNHGGGPMPLLGDAGHAELVEGWAEGTRLHRAVHSPAVKAIVMVSAHHVSQRVGAVDVQADGAAGAGKMLFDYGGFPPESYRLVLPNPSDTSIASRITSLLTTAGIKTTQQRGRGYDHGCFVPLLGLRTPPSVPVVQVSLCPSSSTAFHIKLGAALAPLRREGVLLVASGMTFHNMRALMRRPPGAAEKSAAFDTALSQLVVAGQAAQWETAPEARFAQPEGQEEHLAPLLVAAGAAQGVAGGPPAAVETEHVGLMGFRVTNFIFTG